MSNYGPPSGNDPYGAPGGGNPYGPPGGQPGFGGQEPAKTDGVSIAAFVLSLLCCTSIIGLVMGIVGLGRTKDGKRKGRWAAIAAVVIGLLGTLAFVGSIVFVVAFAGESVDDLEAGQCVDGDGLRETDEDTVGSISVVSCSESHDGEVLATGTLTGDQADEVGSGEETAVCADLLSEEELATISSGDYSVFPLSEDTSPASGDAFACILIAADGSALTEKVGD